MGFHLDLMGLHMAKCIKLYILASFNSDFLNFLDNNYSHLGNTNSSMYVSNV